MNLDAWPVFSELSQRLSGMHTPWGVGQRSPFPAIERHGRGCDKVEKEPKVGADLQAPPPQRRRGQWLRAVAARSRRDGR
jgi:hypothetical protein